MRRLVFGQSSPVHALSESRGGPLSVTKSKGQSPDGRKSSCLILDSQCLHSLTVLVTGITPPFTQRCPLILRNTAWFSEMSHDSQSYPRFSLTPPNPQRLPLILKGSLLYSERPLILREAFDSQSRPLILKHSWFSATPSDSWRWPSDS